MMFTTRLAAGDLVRVRSKEEILGTLDAKGCLDGLPFMPEMFRFCGQTLRVYKRAHKTCDTIDNTGGRTMESAVHLEDVRCDGAFHGGCQATCLIFWKEAWLEAVEGPAINREESAGGGCTESTVMAATQLQDSAEETRYVCQATQMTEATTALAWWDVRQYAEDYLSGNVGIWRLVSGAVYSAYYNLSILGVPGLNRVMRWVYDQVQKRFGGVPYPRKRGRIPLGQPTPVQALDLQPGELVRIKSHDEILETLNRKNRNRGMFFDAEEVPYCGGTYRVTQRVEKIIDEKTGRMIHFETPSVILDGVYCQSRYSDRRMFCPRSVLAFWREIWLERVDATAEDKVEG